jgi:hypothetical protein
MIIYMEATLNLMLASGMQAEVQSIIDVASQTNNIKETEKKVKYIIINL